MPIPTLITDLSTTIASNSPAGSDAVFPDIDNYVRALSGFLASIRANSGNGWVSPYATAAAPTITGVASFTGTVQLTGTSSALGYEAGSGGTVTQLTSKATSVTLNKGSGRITMNNAALASGSWVAFAVNNSLVDNGDIVVVNHNGTGGTAGAYAVETLVVGTGYFSVRVENLSAGSLSEAVTISFAVITGATA